MKSAILSLAVVVALSAPAAPEKPQAPTVFVQQIVRAQLSDTLTYPARLMSKTSATLLSETDGVVTRIEAGLGKSVKKGDPILVVRNTDPVYQYAPLTVRSSVAGTVSSVDVTVGSRVTRGQKVASVTDPAKLKILIEVPAKDVASLQPGMKGELVLPGREKPAPVTIEGVSPFVDPGTGTASVELKPAASEGLSPGSIGRVAFRLRERAGIELPEDAIVYRGRKPTVRIVEGGKARYVPVTLGPTRQGKVEIVEGLSDGAQVIVRSIAFVAEGETVQVQEAEAAGS